MFDNIIQLILFYSLAIIIIASSLGLVFLPNLLHACISMFIAFFSAGMLFILLNSDFLGIIQIAVYSFAVCIMFAIIIMLSGQKIRKFDIKALAGKTLIAWFSVFVFFVTLLFSITNGFSLYDRFTKPFSMAIDISKLGLNLPANFSIKILSVNLLSKYIFSFELISLVILIALIGVVILYNVKKYKEEEEKNV